jgi:hypothetical protein
MKLQNLTKDTEADDYLDAHLQSFRDPLPPEGDQQSYGPGLPADEGPLMEGVANGLIPKIMAFAISPQGAVSYYSVLNYRNEFLLEAGDPADPVERLLLEQLAVAHVVSMNMHFLCTYATTLSQREVYGRAAVTLMSETRRMGLAIKEYRSPPLRPQITKIDQQNISRQQKVNYAAPSEPNKPERPKSGKSGHQTKSRRKVVIDAPREFGREAEIRRPHCGGKAQPNAPRAVERSRPELAEAESA